ncbi:MAG TPA: hypothetical protein VGD97_13720 [Lacunisphaera sp.]
MGDGQVLDLAVAAGVSNSVQQVNAGTTLNGFSMALIGVSLGMASPLMAIADAVDNPALLAPLNIAFSALAGAGAIVGAPASILTGDAFDSYSVGGPGRAYMPGVFTNTASGEASARRLVASYLSNNSHYRIGKVGIGDLAQIVFDSVSVITAPSINTFLSAASGTTEFVFHSQGTATGANGLRLVPASMRNDIHVAGAGGQWHLNAGILGYGSATNFTASLDPVPYMSPRNYLSRMLSGQGTQNKGASNATNSVNFDNHSFDNVYLNNIKTEWRPRP